jgi:hypothetical protein
MTRGGSWQVKVYAVFSAGVVSETVSCCPPARSELRPA